MTLAQLQILGRQWQERLNLREWEISFSWGARGLEGRCIWHAEDGHADVEVNRSSRDKEATLVHELLHIVLEGHDREARVYSIPHERAINKITCALLGRGIE